MGAPGRAHSTSSSLSHALVLELERSSARAWIRADLRKHLLAIARDLEREADRLDARIRGGHCLECGCAVQACSLMWRDQRKCCPDCTHA